MGSKNKNRNKKKIRQSAERFNKNELSIENAKHCIEENETNSCEENESITTPANINKRHHDGNGSDSEDKPKTKKKKKQPLTSDSSDKKRKKSIRQMKREKFAQRQSEAQAMAKDQLKSQCLNYLSQWKHDKQNWKFMKAKQVWLYKNKFSTILLPDSSWSLLLEYFESAQGNIRKMLLDDANKIIKQMDEWTESQTAEEAKNVAQNDVDTTSKIQKPDDLVYKRARDLIQCLEE